MPLEPTPNPFVVVFQVGSHIFCPGLAVDHTQYICLHGVSLTFCQGWPQACILLVINFHKTGVTGMSHDAWLLYTLGE
jgi:hypothetical protein